MHVKSWTISLQLICSAFLNHLDYWRFLRSRLFHPTRFISLPNSSSSDKWIASDTFLSTPTKRNWPLQFSTPRSLFLFSVSLGFRFQELIHNIALHSTKNHLFWAYFSHFLSQVFKAAHSMWNSLLQCGIYLFNWPKEGKHFIQYDPWLWIDGFKVKHMR